VHWQKTMTILTHIAAALLGAILVCLWLTLVTWCARRTYRADLRRANRAAGCQIHIRRA
jgi:hypothetical protein